MKCPISETTFNNWEVFIDHRPDFLIEDLEIFNDYYVIAERNMGLLKLNVNSWNNKESYTIPFDSETYTAYMGINLDFNSNKLRYHFSSLNTPSSVIEYDFISKKNNILKVQEVIDDNFNSENYITERVWAKSHDNVEIPISIVRHKNTIKSSETPLLLYAYGSYGHTVDPYFSSVRLSLLDRGFIFAIAHIRGGEYLGREWYENGKLLKKKNTFFDFIECGKFLINKNYTSKKHLYAMGGSAGGLLMGAIVNLEPTLFKGIIAAVPFVDVVTTMLDDSIPLTTLEYNEWGNPNDKDYYSYIKSYSPYDNVSEKKYPYILATAGYHDSQVQYWEPAKWVAKLRDYNNSENPILLHTNMDAGHGGASGRFKILKEVAMEYAFLIGIEKKLL
jgi:oligopeptidase B